MQVPLVILRVGIVVIGQMFKIEIDRAQGRVGRNFEVTA